MTLEEAIIEKVRALSPEKQAQVLKFADSLGVPEKKRPLRDPSGLWAGLDIDISEEDLTELRREMWKNFPREDI